jgi:hypothetical protein
LLDQGVDALLIHRLQLMTFGFGGAAFGANHGANQKLPETEFVQRFFHFDSDRICALALSLGLRLRHFIAQSTYEHVHSFQLLPAVYSIEHD